VETVTADSGKARRFKLMVGELRVADIFCVVLLDQWFLTGAARPPGGVKRFPGGANPTCSTTWKVFEQECVTSKRYTSANFPTEHVS